MAAATMSTMISLVSMLLEVGEATVTGLLGSSIGAHEQYYWFNGQF